MCFTERGGVLEFSCAWTLVCLKFHVLELWCAWSLMCLNFGVLKEWCAWSLMYYKGGVLEVFCARKVVCLRFCVLECATERGGVISCTMESFWRGGRGHMPGHTFLPADIGLPPWARQGPHLTWKKSLPAASGLGNQITLSLWWWDWGPPRCCGWWSKDSFEFNYKRYSPKPLWSLWFGI